MYLFISFDPSFSQQLVVILITYAFASTLAYFCCYYKNTLAKSDLGREGLILFICPVNNSSRGKAWQDREAEIMKICLFFFVSVCFVLFCFQLVFFFLLNSFIKGISIVFSLPESSLILPTSLTTQTLHILSLHLFQKNKNKNVNQNKKIPMQQK